jgi:hypothetical protein
MRSCVARIEYVRIPSMSLRPSICSFQSSACWRFEPENLPGVMSMAPIHVPSRCGWLLPSVQVQMAVFGSAAAMLHLPCDRSSRCASEMSNSRFTVTAVGFETSYERKNNQPSSSPLPLQPPHEAT